MGWSYFYYLYDFVRLRLSHVKILAPLPGIAKIDIVKKLVWFDLNFLLVCVLIVFMVLHGFVLVYTHNT